MEGNNGVAVENEPRDEAVVMIDPRTPSFSARSSPFVSSVDSDVDPKHEDEEYRAIKRYHIRINNLRKRVASTIIRSIFVCIVGILIASLTVPKLTDTLIWGLELWKWTFFVLDILYGWWICKWFLLIPAAFVKLICPDALILWYVMIETRKSVGALIWLGSISLAWVFSNRGVERSRGTKKIQDHVTRGLVGCLAGAVIWLVKSFLIKLLTFQFGHGRFMDRIDKLALYQKLDRAVSDPKGNNSLWRLKSLSYLKVNKERTIEQEDIVDVGKREKGFAGTIMEGLFKVIRFVFLIFSPKCKDDREEDMETTREVGAKAAANKIIRKVSRRTDSKKIPVEDFEDFVGKNDAERLILMFPEGYETGRIKKSDLKNWLVECYKENEELQKSLNYTRRALEKLNRLASGTVIAIGIIVWCMIMEILTTQVLVLISSQIVLAAFMFGNTAKTVFEAIIFVFIMHPFDVGDRCVIDDEQMLVEEINILHTIFRKNDMEKIFYPNAVLLSKPILNSFRNPEMDDSVEFNIDLSTSAKTIGALKRRIKIYLLDNFLHWHPEHSVVVKDIDSTTGNLKMALCVTHNINFQSSGEKSSRRSDLILELKKILKQLNVKHRMLPQEVHVKYI